MNLSEELYSILAEMIDTADNSDDVDMAINQAIGRILLIDYRRGVEIRSRLGSEPRTAAGSLD
jgi:hypothetical protein